MKTIELGFLSGRLDINGVRRRRLLRGVPVGLLIGLVLAGCGAEPGTGSESDTAKTGQEPVIVYWKSGTSDIINHTTVSRAEVNDVLARRAKLRESADLAHTADVGRSREALTTGSTDWANVCSQFNSYLVTSAADGGGDFFCAVYSEPFSRTGIAMPFVPQWFDRSSTHWFSLCTSASNCFVGDGPCFGLPPPVWNAYSPGFGGGNISPPSTVLFINSQVEPLIC